MFKVGELTDVGRFIRQILSENPKQKNRDIATLIVNHFPGQQFDMLALRQRIANCKYLARRKRTVSIVTKN